MKSSSHFSSGRFTPILYIFVAPALVLLQGCASKPPPPDWQLSAKGAAERFVTAYLTGHDGVEAAEFSRARTELSGTGRADLVARAELLRCASRVASVVFEPCTGFESLRQDAGLGESAYGDYLAGTLKPQDVPLLPAGQRQVATAAGPQAQAAALTSMADPLAQLVAAGVLFKRGDASPAVFQIAVDAASAQGWRRPLLAWLGLQQQRAAQAGDQSEVARLNRRMALVGGAAAGAGSSTGSGGAALP